MLTMRSLHLFGSYLPPSQNWAFHLMENISDSEIVVGAESFLNTDFYSNEHQYIKFPVPDYPQSRRDILARIMRKIREPLFRNFYLRQIKSQAGQVDVIHSHFGDIGWQHMRLEKLLNVPHVVSFYGYDYLRIPTTNPVWNERYKQLFHQADCFISEGHHAARLLEKIGCPKDKIRICPLGVEVDNIPAYQRKKQKNEVNLLQLATFREKKGHVYTIDAFLLALNECPDMTLTLVGDDPENLKETLVQKVKLANAGDKVFFVDAIDYEKLHEFLKDYHVFIHPSCHAEDGDCEGGAPVVLLDAQATGMPVIATRHCDIPEEVIDQKTGVLADEKDVSQLAGAIKKFYRMSQQEYNSFGENAQEHIKLNYNIKKSGHQLRGIYTDLIKKRADEEVL